MQTKRSAADLSAIQADGKSRSVRMLAAYMDLGARYKMVGKQQRASAELRGLRIETRVTLGDDKVTAAPALYLFKQPSLLDEETICIISQAHHDIWALCPVCAGVIEYKRTLAAISCADPYSDSCALLPESCAVSLTAGHGSRRAGCCALLSSA